jgi:hypothetical protein
MLLVHVVCKLNPFTLRFFIDLEECPGAVSAVRFGANSAVFPWTADNCVLTARL